METIARQSIDASVECALAQAIHVQTKDLATTHATVLLNTAGAIKE